MGRRAFLFFALAMTTGAVSCGGSSSAPVQTGSDPDATVTDVDGASAGDGGDGGASADGDMPTKDAADAAIVDAEADAEGPTDGNVSADANVDANADAMTTADASDAAAGNVVAVENSLPGTTAWMLSNPATSREIEGYAGETSVAPGSSLPIFVSTASAQYTITVYRLGWYAGKGGREVSASTLHAGGLQPTPSPDADGLVECAWSTPHTLSIPSSWVSGVYLAKLETANTGKQSYVPFVVRDDVRAATYLFQSSVTTFQAYNNWGGRSLYDFNSVGGVRASRVSFLRPYAMGENPESAAGVGAGELLTNLQGASNTGPMGWELPMLRFVEREGYDVSYATNVDVHRDPERVARHRVMLSVGHDEYWTSEMRDHVEHARDRAGTGLAFFSGNVSYWQSRLSASKSGKANATLTCFKDELTDPLTGSLDGHQTTVRFGSTVLQRGEEGLTGVRFQDYGVNGDLVVSDPASWIFAGTNLAAGAHLVGLLGYEVEGAPEPLLPGVLAVMRSPWSTVRGSGVASTVVRKLPSGAEVFAAGSIQFPWGLDGLRLAGVTQPDVSSAAAQSIARNVLSRLAAPLAKVNRTPTLFSDSFVTVGSDRWSARIVSEGSAAYDPLVNVAVTSGQLIITPRANATGLRHGGFVSRRSYAMRCGSARVRLVQATSASSQADTTFAIAADAGHWLRMTVEGSTLVFGLSQGGVVSNTTTAFSAASHAHLRLRHDCVSGMFLFETSADGISFTVRRAVAASPSLLNAAYVELEAGTYQAENSPGQAIFDDVHVETTGVHEDFSAQRDPETLTPDAIHEGGYDPRVRAIVHAGVLRLRTRAGVSGQHHMGFASTRELDWTGGITRARILAAPSATTEASVSLAVLSQAPGWARTAVSAGKIFFQSQDLAANVTGTSITFDPSLHQYVRIRHDRVADAIVWETSANGVSWTERRRVARSFPLTSARAEIEAGTYRAETQATEAVIDDFVFAR